MNTVRQLQRTLYRQAKQDKEVKFYSLYDKLWREDVLWEAWRHVKANGCDRSTPITHAAFRACCSSLPLTAWVTGIGLAARY